MTTVFHHVGPFEILGQIGHGGMAQVFLADDTRHGRRVALKLVQLRDDRQGRDILDAERRGAQLQGRLSDVCPLVPKLYDDGDLPPYYFIAMEFVAGEDLSTVIARGPLKPDEAVGVARQLCQFLEAAHALETSIDGVAFRSMVHGDLKPGNVRISSAGEVKVLDFGIAKALSLSRKVTRNEFGSLPYMSPERLDSDAQEVGRPADLWALGVILYELLGGAAPFHASDTRRLEGQIRAGYHGRPLPETVPPGLRAITARLLAPLPAGRYESATSVVEDLDTHTNGQTTVAEQQGFLRPSDEVATRRTRPAPDDDATRRTSPGSTATSIPAAIPASADAATRRTKPERTVPDVAVDLRKTPPVAAKRTWRLPSLRTVLLFLAFVTVANEVAVGSSASRLAAAASTKDLEGITSMWDDYDRLYERSLLHVGVVGLQRSLRARVLDLSEQVMANYRTALPTVRERQWKAAQTNLQRALALDPGNTRLHADLRYCDGHLHRIDGEAEKARGHRGPASQHFADAVTAFREAAELRPSWPDPFLGLARTFIYGLEDTDRAADALKQAQQRGHAIGDRETAQLGDGYRARGDSLRQTARRLVHLPQEAEYLQRAIAAYRAALAQYEQIAEFPGVAISLQRVHAIVDSLENRAAELTAEKDRAEQAGRWE